MVEEYRGGKWVEAKPIEFQSGFIGKIIDWFIDLFSVLLFNHDRCYDRCYKSMENDGHAHDGKCCGCCGGDWKTDYLSEMCCDCKHLDLTISHIK